MPASSLPPKKFSVNKIVLNRERLEQVKKSIKKHKIKAAQEEKLEKEKIETEKADVQEKLDVPVEGTIKIFVLVVYILNYCKKRIKGTRVLLYPIRSKKWKKSLMI